MICSPDKEAEGQSKQDRVQPSLQSHPGPVPGLLPILSLRSQEGAGVEPPYSSMALQLQTSALSPSLPLRFFSVSNSSWPLMVSRGREALHTSLPAPLPPIPC